MKVNIDEKEFFSLCSRFNHHFSDEAISEIFIEMNRPIYLPLCSVKNILVHFEETSYVYKDCQFDFIKTLENGKYLYGYDLEGFWG